MKAHTTKERPVFLKRFEAVLLVVCLCVLAVRSMYIESPHTGFVNPDLALTSEAFSIVITSVLMLTAVAWFLVALCSPGFVYRFSGIETGVVLFFVAGIAGVVVASNKRAAITDMATLLAPMLAAVVLVQILDGPSRIRLVLFTALALGVVATYQCTEQLFTGNEEMIADYMRNPQKHLDVIGAEVGSFEHMLYEQRLFGKDIRGFLTTSNSTGSFLLLCAFAGVGLFVDSLAGRGDRRLRPAIICLALVSATVIAGLIITRSRGALAAGAVCAAVFIATVRLGNVFYRYRRLLFLLVIVILAAGAAVVVSYGISHGTLPGGASMLVRWQYWDGAARMYADKPLTGVGGGNFSSYYPHYKIPAAPETVSDPHNFLLSLLSQYGPLGLIGFTAGFIAVLLKTVFSASRYPVPKQSPHSSAGPWAALCVVCLSLLIFRPLLLACPLGGRAIVMISAVIILYVIPVIVFAVIFWLLQASRSRLPEETLPAEKASRIALFCGIAAVVIHNIIDFAIFEPAVLTLFWMFVACLCATDALQKNISGRFIRPARLLRVPAVAATVLFAVIYLHFAVVPTVRSGWKIQRALKQPFAAHALFDAAADDDPFNPVPLNYGGKAYLGHFSQTGKQQRHLLESAARRFAAAARRDTASFKNYEKLAQVYQMLAETETGDRRDYLQKALRQFQEAVKRYPGSGRLNLKLAEVAEQLGADEIALEHYRRAVEIEDSYRRQFRVMYPAGKLFSRLGEKNYQLARQRLARLMEQ